MSESPQLAADKDRLLTIKFWQFFYLQNYQTLPLSTDPKNPDYRRGGVVLLPGAKHDAYMCVPGREAISLKQVQVHVTEDGKMLWRRPTRRPRPENHADGATGRFLLSSNALFERRVRVVDDLLSSSKKMSSGRTSPDISSRLNARIVLSGGDFIDVPAALQTAQKIKWRFFFEKRPAQLHVLTDRLDFRLPLKAGREYSIVIWRNDGSEEAIPLVPEMGDSPIITIENLDRDAAKPLEAKDYTLHEYHDLHALLDIGAPDVSAPIARYPGGSANPEFPTCRQKIRTNSQPICGGEEGDPDPPDDPNYPPDPPDP